MQHLPLLSELRKLTGHQYFFHEIVFCIAFFVVCLFILLWSCFLSLLDFTHPVSWIFSHALEALDTLCANCFYVKKGCGSPNIVCNSLLCVICHIKLFRVRVETVPWSQVMHQMSFWSHLLYLITFNYPHNNLIYSFLFFYLKG